MTFFILGAHPELSIAELRALLEIDARLEQLSIEVAATETVHNIETVKARVAGVSKIGETFAELTSWNEEEAADVIAAFAREAAGKQKISFGISVYDAGDRELTGRLTKRRDQLGLAIKKRLKDTGRSIRFVSGKERALSSVIVESNHLLESGGEFVVLCCNDRVLLGQTSWIQDFKGWADRDFGRPARDPHNGMLPPKLARLMINLSGATPENTTLLDPFCGSGTILMEGMLMGFKKIIGSDISPQAIEDTGRNLTWVTNRLHLSPPALSLFTTSADKLSSQMNRPVDALVTEVFLGSPRLRPLAPNEKVDIEQKLLELYTSSFAALQPLMKPDARAVVAFPAFKMEDGSWHHLPLESLLSKLGYSIHQQFLYYRADQLVARDLIVFSK